jgi:preprotein translocase subunit SecA
MSQKYFFNNIVEMQSSNGKSLVISVASIIYALWGFEVYCCQKNDYLVKRNRAANEFLFTFLGV